MAQTLSYGQNYLNCTPLWGRLAFSGVLAIGLHHGLFIHQEWHLYSHVILIFHLFAFVLYTFFLIMMEDRAIKSSVLEAMLVSSNYLIALLTSILVYRLFFHRLSRAGFPGPYLARTSKIWHAWACKNSRNFVVLDKFAQQYGDFVRTGEIAQIFCSKASLIPCSSS